jgi:hypothetical protein
VSAAVSAVCVQFCARCWRDSARVAALLVLAVRSAVQLRSCRFGLRFVCSSVRVASRGSARLLPCSVAPVCSVVWQCCWECSFSVLHVSFCGSCAVLPVWQCRACYSVAPGASVLVLAVLSAVQFLGPVGFFGLRTGAGLLAVGTADLLPPS